MSDSNCQEVQKLLSTKPENGKNLVISGHQLALIKLGIFKTNELEEGNCGIFKPKGSGRFELIAHISPKVWESLRKEAEGSSLRR